MDYIISQIKISKFLIADFTVNPEENIKIDDKTSDELDNSRVKNGTRGGVYFEAGYARGMGLKVIHTCKNDNISKNRLHFDIAQDNTLFWNDKDIIDCKVRNAKERSENVSPINFAENVFDRIVSIFVYGKNYKKI